jgi:molybdopterin/thiamine biosynthesis adenylyltransferase
MTFLMVKEGVKMNIKVIGLGGVGSVLCDNLFRFVNYLNGEFNVTLVDGKSYKERNKVRQSFSGFGNKARIKRMDLISKFDNLNVETCTQYITRHNINEIIEEDDVIFLCVDNHNTRKLVSDYCTTLKKVVLISGGNEFVDGNVQMYIRENGKKLTPSLTDYHSEIDNPVDRSPDQMSCEELAVSEPQLLFSNITVALIMCWYFYDLTGLGNVRSGKNSEVFFDIENMNVRPAQRAVI